MSWLDFASEGKDEIAAEKLKGSKAPRMTGASLLAGALFPSSDQCKCGWNPFEEYADDEE